MLLRSAKIAGGLRLLITETGPIIATSVGLLSARSVAYLVGFGLGSIVSSWLPIVALLVSMTGFFGAGANSPECEAYRAQMRAIDDANRAAMAAYQIASQPYIAASQIWTEKYLSALNSAHSGVDACAKICAIDTGNHRSAGFVCFGCRQSHQERTYREAAEKAGPVPLPPSPPVLQTYPACSSPDCLPGKKVWTQVVWASSSGNFTDPKGCFIVAYSQDAPTLPPKIEYNPFLPELYVESRALSYYLVDSDKYRGLQDNEWKNLESVQGWDKGYWHSEVTDPECRGWRPGWSRKIK
jgi:hypothetical protein